MTPTLSRHRPRHLRQSLTRRELKTRGEVINVETKLVTIPVRVLDRKNRFIGGLAKENFKYF